jgi:mannose-1-phosphate guanylyltransferase
MPVRTDCSTATGPGATWVIVLAGGEGTRLAPLTTALYGRPLPKQFATLAGKRSLLQATLIRARSLAPWPRVLVVANEQYLDLAERQCREVGGAMVVAQPSNRGTAAGLLLPLAHIHAADAAARVVVLPSDHYVSRPRVLEEWLGDVAALRPRAEDGILLVGVRPDAPMSDYGWIVPGSALTIGQPAIHEVAGFVEKPRREVAAALMRKGALWNTFIMCGHAGAFWTAARQGLGGHAARFMELAGALGAPGASGQLRRLYTELPEASFSIDVLQRAPSLRVAAAPPCGWSDWGTPDRVLDSLAGTPALESLKRRLRPALSAEQPS